MMAYTHAVFGAFIYLIGGVIGIFPVDPFYLFVAMFGALFPDIDHPFSYISLRLRTMSANWRLKGSWKVKGKIRTGTSAEGAIFVVALFMSVLMYFYATTPNIQDFKEPILIALVFVFIVLGRYSNKIFRERKRFLR